MIISTDPSGTSTTACFLYWHWDKWEFICFEDKPNNRWQKHVDFVADLVLKNKKELTMLLIEENYKQPKFANIHFNHLLKAIGGIETFCYKEEIPYKMMASRNQWWMKEHMKQGKIAKLVKNPKNYNRWEFNGRVLNEHERDALLQFYAYWTRIEKNPWPWS